MGNRKVRAVGYARVSTKNQLVGREFNSIDTQKAIIVYYAQTHSEIELVQIFSDPGRSGKNMKRPGMQAMIERIKQGDIDCVLAYKLDRVSRDGLDYLTLESELRGLNVSIIYTNDANPDDTPMGHIQRHMMVGFAQFEREQNAQRVCDKHLELLKQGYHAGGYPPLGYNCGEKKCTLVIDPPAAPHVREMFALCVKGKTPAEIASIMLKKYGTVPEHKTRNGRIYGGNRYCENFVRRVLTNPVYAGYVSRKKTELFEGLHEAIISRADWETACKVLAPKPQKLRPQIMACNSHILKGKLFCGCGAAMTCGASGKRHKDGSLYHYYICSAKNRERTARMCKTGIAKSVLESVVFSAIGYAVTRGIPLKEIRESSQKYESELLKEQKELANLKRDKERKLREKVKLFGEVAGNEVLRKAIEDELQKLSEEVEKLAARLSEIAKETELFNHDTDLGDLQTKAALADMDSVQNELTVEEKKALARDAIEKLTLTAKSQSKYKRRFLLKIVPTCEYLPQLGILDIEFEVDTAKGRSDWKIVAPFEIASENYEQNHKPREYKPQKRHWLHTVVAWQAKIGSGATMAEIAELSGVSVPMVCRKLKLLERLNAKVIEKILSSKLAETNERLSFRTMEMLSKLPKSGQLLRFAELIQK